MSINTLRMIGDHVDDEIKDLEEEIAKLVESLHEKQSRLATLQSLRLLADLHGGNDANGAGTEVGDRTTGPGVQKTRDQFDYPAGALNKE